MGQRPFMLLGVMLVSLLGATPLPGEDPSAGSAGDGPSSTAVRTASHAGLPRVASPEGFRDRFFTGAFSGDRFGYAVASAGDVNGDGFDDVVVGAPYNDDAGMEAGAVYVYFGGLTTRTSPDVIYRGAAAGERFGISVAGAGDLNGDGYGDVVVGAPYSSISGGTGIARIYFGDPLLGLLPDPVTLRGVRPGDEFGLSVAGAGDVNGDGWADLVIGAWHNDIGGSDAGCAYVYFGGPSFDRTADVTLPGTAAEDWVGYAVGGAGDVNGDGYADVIIGAHGDDAGGFNAGRAYILFGGDTMDATPDVTLTGASPLGVFGVSVSGAGDVNGDGYADVIVGAERENLGGADAGRAYVFYGGPAMDTVPDAALIGGTPGDLFGHVATAAGDVDGDGYGDVLVSANWNDAGGFNAGRVYLYFGGHTMDELPDAIFTGAAAEDMFGQSAACAGDVNGDGLDDLIVGADYNNAGGYDAGRAYLYLNSLTGSDLPDLVYTADVLGDQLGYALDGAGDVNGDGYGDFIIGAWSKYSSGSSPGYAWVCFGGAELSAAAKLTLSGEHVADHFGVAVSRAGDVNGDGFDDVIVGASHYGPGGMGEGRAYLYYGGTAMDASADVKFSSPVSGSGFGNVVAGAGDVNGDGYADLLIGSLSPPVVRLYFGGQVADNVADRTFAPPAASAAAGIGDVNGDGFDDVIVGSAGDNLGGTHTGIGSARVYFGGVSMDTTADLTLTGEADGDGFGYSVAGAGDLNADGYADIAIGAPHNDTAGKDAGRVYIFCGGLQLKSTPDLVIPAYFAGEEFGSAAAGGGDVNADGYADLIVGAASNSTSGPYAGRAYVFYGGYWMDSAPDLTLTGTEAIAEFGIAVAGVGDVNGDRRADLLVGAVNGGSVGGGIGYGKAFLFISSSPPIVPRIMSVQDVSGDQGGQVWVRWVRSGYDMGSGSGIKQYILERSTPPGVSGFAWETIATVEANGNPRYLVTAPTWNDSPWSQGGAVFFRVTAVSYIPTEFWRSNVLAGSSTDNLAPIVPAKASLMALPNGWMHLAWQANRTDHDVRHYAVYRSMTDGFLTADSTLLVVTRDSTVIDSTAEAGNRYYYRVTCVDVHGNQSPPTAQLSGVVTGSEDSPGEVTSQYVLHQNYPNPFNASSDIGFRISELSDVRLRVFDLLGREIATLVNERKPAGSYVIRFDASGLASGMYLYRLEAGGAGETRKMSLIR